MCNYSFRRSKRINFTQLLSLTGYIHSKLIFPFIILFSFESLADDLWLQRLFPKVKIIFNNDPISYNVILFTRHWTSFCISEEQCEFKPCEANKCNHLHDERKQVTTTKQNCVSDLQDKRHVHLFSYQKKYEAFNLCGTNYFFRRFSEHILR